MVKRLAIGAMLLLACLRSRQHPCRIRPQGRGRRPRLGPRRSAASAHGEAGEKKEGDQGGASSLNPVANPNLGLSVWTAVVFVVVLLILRKFAWKPIREGLQKREDEIAGQIAQAQRKNEEARQLLVEYEKKLSAAGDDVRAALLIAAAARPKKSAGSSWTRPAKRPVSSGSGPCSKLRPPPCPL